MAEHLTWRSANPALKADTFARAPSVVDEEAMTLVGTVNKTALALLVLLVSATWEFAKFLGAREIFGCFIAFQVTKLVKFLGKVDGHP